VDAMRKFLPREGLFDSIIRGSRVILSQDVESIITLLVDAEMRMFRGLPTPVIFLQNVITDLVQGIGFAEAFEFFARHVRDRYDAEPGFITMNLPKLLPLLNQVGIKNPIVCANVNKVEFRMTGGAGAYREATQQYPARVIAMSVLASGGIAPREAIEWVVNEPYVQSILFGASTRNNIEHTVSLIHEFDSAR
jgi:hypothetical protein